MINLLSLLGSAKASQALGKIKAGVVPPESLHMTDAADFKNN